MALLQHNKSALDVALLDVVFDEIVRPLAKREELVKAECAVIRERLLDVRTMILCRQSNEDVRVLAADVKTLMRKVGD